MANDILKDDVDGVVADHASGVHLLLPGAIGALFKKEISAPTDANDKYVRLASAVSAWILDTFEARIARLAKVGTSSVVMLNTARSGHARNLAKPVSVQVMRDKLPVVIKKIQRGDLTRFVWLVTSSHAYGVCLGCGETPHFSMLHPPQMLAPMSLLMDIDDTSVLKSLAMEKAFDFSAKWLRMAGFCGESKTCNPECADCGRTVPTRLDAAWVRTHLEDRMCPPCASRQLINVKRPSFNRTENRQLRRLIIY